MRVRRPMSVLVSLVLSSAALAAVPGSVSAGGPTTVQYPSSECPDTGDEGLQQCIDSVEAGSTVVLVDEIIEEAAEIAKDLTLKAIDRSLQPVLLGVVVRSEVTDPSLRVTVQDIRMQVTARVVLIDGADHDVRLRRLEVGKGTAFARGISVNVEVPATVTIEGSYIRSDDESQDDALGISVDDPDGPVTVRVIGNRINLHGNSDSGAGIDLSMEGDGSVRADVLNNTIWDVARCNCGAASGVAVDPDGPIRADVNIVGNTFERSATNAIQQRNTLTGSGRLNLDVFDNVFSHHTTGAVNLDAGAGGSLVFRAGYNDYFANGESFFDGESKGPGNLSKDPKYIDRSTGNLRLQSTSPLIDKGLVCSPGGVANLDASGNGRLSGTSVDMGAYERGAGDPTGVARVGTGADNTLEGTSHDDILCGYSGDDTLRGKGGRDWLDGGPDDDRLTAGNGPDRSYGGSGRDVLCSNDGVHGNDRADGGPGTDKGRTDSGDTKVSIEATASC